MKEIRFIGWEKDWKKMFFGIEAGKEGYCNNMILMQFTGLKDKKGKEIYDDFLIEYKKNIFQVYQSQTGEWRARYKELNYSLFNIFNLSIIKGNIYENPDLIARKDVPK